jgi:hypothetical protein
MRRRHLFVPHRFLTPQIHAEYVLHNRPTAVQTWSVYFSVRPRCTRSSRGKLVSKGRSVGTALEAVGEGDGLSFQTSTLSQANIYRASLMGDQATMKRRLGAVDGRRSVDSNACRSSAAVRKEGLKLSCAHRKRRTEYQARDAARGQSQ